MPYAAASDVFAHVRSLVLPSASFDSATCPTLTEVNFWLTSGCSVIETKLASHGYGTIPTSSQAYGLAQECNALFAAWFAERSRLNARVSPGERTRADLFKRDFTDLLEILCGMDLSRAGVTVLSTGRAYSGGRTISYKETLEADTDRVKPRFVRDMGKNPDRLDWNGTTAS